MELSNIRPLFKNVFIVIAGNLSEISFVIHAFSSEHVRGGDADIVTLISFPWIYISFIDPMFLLVNTIALMLYSKTKDSIYQARDPLNSFERMCDCWDVKFG